MEQLKVLSLNVWGLRYLSKDLDLRIEALAELFSQGHYDIIGLQEVWVEKHYLLIRDKVKDVLPYSHRFLSGYLGTGCVTFSKYPIVDTMFQRYSFNGYFYDFTHGDWFAGKGVTGCVIKHPKKNIYFFNTHMHANYDFESDRNHFHECRTLQAYQAAQFIRHVTRPGDAIIMAGDFNHEPHELGMTAMKELLSLRDTFDIAKEKEEQCYTVDSKFNNVYNDPREPCKRIDFVLVNDFFECLECKLACRKIPGTDMHYSDHEGFEVTLKFNHDKTSVPHSMMEDYRSRDLLSKLHKCMLEGEGLSAKMSWYAIALIGIIFMLIGFPFSYGLDYFAHPSSTFARFIFVLQMAIAVFCAVYLWVVAHVRKLEIHGFQRVAREIEVKIGFLNTLNNKKSD